MLGGICLTNTKSRDEASPLGEMIFAALKGTLVGIGTSALLSLILTAIALMTKDPDKLIGIFAYAALFISALACGISSVKSDSEQRLLTAILGSAGYVLIVWLLSLFFRADTAEPLPPVWMTVGYVGCIITAFLGALIAKPKRMRVRDGSNVSAQVRRQLTKRV